MAQKEMVSGTGTNIPPTPTPKPLPTLTIVLAANSSVSVNNGGSQTVNFIVVANPKAEVTLKVTGLPSGVTATLTPTSFSSASQQVTLKLTAADNALVTKTDILILASGAGKLATTGVGLTVVSPYSYTPGAPTLQIGTAGESSLTGPTQVRLAAYGSVTVPLNLQFAKGVNGTISLALNSTLPSGVSAQFNRASFTAPDDPGTVSVNLLLTAGANVTIANVSVDLVAKVGTSSRATYTFPFAIVSPHVSAVSPASGMAPMLGQGGSQVTITGGGFAPGTTVAFGADSPIPASSITADGTSLVVSVPPTAASGQLTVTTPACAASGTINFAVDNYRNTRGFSWCNSTPFQNLLGPTYNFADATALFGAAQTTKNIGGGIFPVVNLYAPFVNAFLSVANSFLDSGGQCFGMSLSSLRFSTGQISYGNFPLQPANSEPNGPQGPNVWMLAGPALGYGNNVSPALATYVHQQHMAQLSQQSINNWVSFHVNVNSAAGLLNAIQQAFNAGGKNGIGAMIALNPSIGDGHVVVAYGVVETGGGNFNILVYDPNIQFQQAEDPNSAIRFGQAAASVINVSSGGSWVLPNTAEIFGMPGGTPNWSGSVFGITVIPWNTIPSQPGFPWTEIAALGAAVIGFAAGNADVTQVADAQGHTLLSNGQWNLNAATTLTGARPMPSFGGLGKKIKPAFVGTRQDALTHTVTGNATGTYNFTWLGSGTAITLAAVPTVSGSVDTVTFNQRTAIFTPTQNKAVSLTMVGTGSTSKLPRTATLKTTASTGAAVNMSFDPTAETFAYVHSGAPTSYTFQLTSVSSRGHAMTFTTAVASVATGDTVTFAPNWDQLDSGVGAISVRSIAGAVSNRTLK